MRIALAILAALAAGSGVANAYPQFQLSTGAARCSQCHFSPSGGGLINGYGRFIAGDELSGGSGNAEFLHGVWQPPDWLALGGDLRYAALVNDTGGSEGAEVATFPMQAELYARAEAGPLSLSAIGGLRGAARPRDPSLASRLVAREYYLMYQPRVQGIYLRAGRFFAPYGLRLAEHTAFVRRYLGFHSLEETLGLSAGYLKNDWELHATAFAPDPWRPVGHRGSGGALYYERRAAANRAALGAQARVAVAETDLRATAGGLAKYYWDGPRLLFMSEVDYGVQQIEIPGAGDARRHQLTSHASLTWFPAQRWMLSAGWERHMPDVRARGLARDGVNAQIHWFLRAHLELMVLGRVIVVGEGDGGRPATLALAQLHYYL